MTRRSKRHLLVVITGHRGTGKTHLLRAVHAQLDTRGAGYIDCAEPLAGLPPREQELGLKALRRARGSDTVLLVDHFDHVAARDDLLQGIAGIMEDAVARGTHVLVACQQREALAALPQKVADELKAAVVVESIPIGFDDRVELLHRRATALGYDLPRSVLAFVARAHSADVGVQLAGLEKLLAFASLLRRAPDLEFARLAVADSLMI